MNRKDVELSVMEYLNDKEQYYAHAFDCGDLGILYIWWGRNWEIQWIKVEPLPDEISLEEKNEQN